MAHRANCSTSGDPRTPTTANSSQERHDHPEHTVEDAIFNFSEDSEFEHRKHGNKADRKSTNRSNSTNVGDGRELEQIQRPMAETGRRGLTLHQSSSRDSSDGKNHKEILARHSENNDFESDSEGDAELAGEDGHGCEFHDDDGGGSDYVYTSDTDSDSGDSNDVGPAYCSGEA